MPLNSAKSHRTASTTPSAHIETVDAAAVRIDGDISPGFTRQSVRYVSLSRVNTHLDPDPARKAQGRCHPCPPESHHSVRLDHGKSSLGTGAGHTTPTPPTPFLHPPSILSFNTSPLLKGSTQRYRFQVGRHQETILVGGMFKTMVADSEGAHLTLVPSFTAEAGNCFCRWCDFLPFHSSRTTPSTSRRRHAFESVASSNPPTSRSTKPSVDLRFCSSPTDNLGGRSPLFLDCGRVHLW